MIISHAHRFVFVKTRKTGGTSVELALSTVCGPADVIVPLDPSDERLRTNLGLPGPRNFLLPYKAYSPVDWARLLVRGRRTRFQKHEGASKIRKALSAWERQSYFTFCFERNPWDKVISFWNFARSWRSNFPSLSEFVRSDLLHEVSDWQRYARGESIVVDHVGRYENLASELEAIARRIGLPPLPELPRAKGQFRKDPRPYWEIFDTEERERVAEVFAREIRHFGYTFGPSEGAS